MKRLTPNLVITEYELGVIVDVLRDRWCDGRFREGGSARAKLLLDKLTPVRNDFGTERIIGVVPS